MKWLWYQIQKETSITNYKDNEHHQRSFLQRTQLDRYVTMWTRLNNGSTVKIWHMFLLFSSPSSRDEVDERVSRETTIHFDGRLTSQEDREYLEQAMKLSRVMFRISNLRSADMRQQTRNSRGNAFKSFPFCTQEYRLRETNHRLTVIGCSEKFQRWTILSRINRK